MIKILIPRTLLLLSLILISVVSCKKKEDDQTDGILALLLAYTTLNPVCSSFTPESAASLVATGNTYLLNSGYYAVTVPAGKQCYFKFTPTTAGIYSLSTYESSIPKLHLGFANKTQTKMPSSSVSFDSENLAANLLSTTPAGGAPTLIYFVQRADSSRLVIADGTDCKSNCKISLKISKQSNTYHGVTSASCTSSSSANSIRFDESGVSIDSPSYFSDCYFLFISPSDTTAQFTQTKTYTGAQNLSMVLSVSAPVTAPTTTFTSAGSNTSTTSATLSGLSTPAGQGRYIKAAYSYTVSDDKFSYTLSNGY